MKVIVSSKGKQIDSDISPVFGRAPWFIMVDSEDMSHESFENPAAGQSGGAGIQAAQFVLEKNPEAVLSSNIGPNAFEVLKAGSLACYTAKGVTVRNAVDAFLSDELISLGSATVNEHAGLSEGSGVHSDGPSGMDEQLEALQTKLRDLRAQVAGILEELDKLKEG